MFYNQPNILFLIAKFDTNSFFFDFAVDDIELHNFYQDVEKVQTL